jgi:hypothetical protein
MPRLSLERFSIVCAGCERTWVRHELTGPGYGDFVLHDADDEMRYVDALSDSVFEEVSQFVARAYPMLDDLQRAYLTKCAFGITCDAAATGTPFNISPTPECRNCGSREISRVSTGQFDQIEVRNVEHSRWTMLSPSDREHELRSVLASTCFPSLRR